MVLYKTVASPPVSTIHAAVIPHRYQITHVHLATGIGGGKEIETRPGAMPAENKGIGKTGK